MKTCADWIQENFGSNPDLDTDELNRLGDPPRDSVYSHIECVNCLVVHHSATATGNSRVFRALHRANNGWEDIGYHFVIGNGSLSADGEVEPGRPVWAAGAHTRGHNIDTLGICLVGNFNECSPTEAQMRSLSKLLVSLMSEYGLSSSSIALHRDMSGCSTECPGENITIKMILDSVS